MIDRKWDDEAFQSNEGSNGDVDDDGDDGKLTTIEAENLSQRPSPPLLDKGRTNNLLSQSHDPIDGRDYIEEDVNVALIEILNTISSQQSSIDNRNLDTSSSSLMQSSSIVNLQSPSNSMDIPQPVHVNSTVKKSRNTNNQWKELSIDWNDPEHVHTLFTVALGHNVHIPTPGISADEKWMCVTDCLFSLPDYVGYRKLSRHTLRTIFGRLSKSAEQRLKSVGEKEIENYPIDYMILTLLKEAEEDIDADQGEDGNNDTKEHKDVKSDNTKKLSFVDADTPLDTVSKSEYDRSNNQPSKSSDRGQIDWKDPEHVHALVTVALEHKVLTHTPGISAEEKWVNATEAFFALPKYSGYRKLSRRSLRKFFGDFVREAKARLEKVGKSGMSKYPISQMVLNLMKEAENGNIKPMTRSSTKANMEIDQPRISIDKNHIDDDEEESHMEVASHYEVEHIENRLENKIPSYADNIEDSSQQSTPVMRSLQVTRAAHGTSHEQMINRLINSDSIQELSNNVLEAISNHNHEILQASKTRLNGLVGKRSLHMIYNHEESSLEESENQNECIEIGHNEQSKHSQSSNVVSIGESVSFSSENTERQSVPVSPGISSKTSQPDVYHSSHATYHLDHALDQQELELTSQQLHIIGEVTKLQLKRDIQDLKLQRQRVRVQVLQKEENLECIKIRREELRIMRKKTKTQREEIHNHRPNTT
jgi:hypothetical protein